MLSGAALDNALAKLIVSRPLGGEWYRAVPKQYDGDPLGRGRPIRAMRFNRDGGTRVLYLGETPTVCLDEVSAVGFPGAVTIYPVEIRLQAVLDLADAATRRALGLTRIDVLRNFRPMNSAGTDADTQILGEACARSAFVEAITFPSAANQGGHALAVIESRLVVGKSHLLVRVPPGVDPATVKAPSGLPSLPLAAPGDPPIWDKLP